MKKNMETLTAIAKLPTYFKQALTKKRTFRGDLWFISGSIYALLVIFVATSLHYIATPITPFSHWVSNLGIGPNGSSFVFNYGLMGTAVLYFVMVLYMGGKFHGVSKIADRLLIASTILGITGVVGIFILTNNVMGPGADLHVLGAYMFFVCTPIFTTMSTWILNLTNAGGPRNQKIMTYFYLIISIMMLPAIFITSALFNLNSHTMLASADPAFAIVRVIEWMSVLSFFGWIFQTGLHFLHNENFPELEARI